MQNQFQPQQNTAAQGVNPALTDQELAFDLLCQGKALMANISSEAVEGSQSGLRNVLNDMFTQMGQDQLQIFQVMNTNGWYQLKPAQPQDIRTAKQKYQQMRQTM